MDKINILIVDDLPEKLLVLESVLEELGENVIAARSGPEALRRVMESNFAVILLDVNMPDMDGYETAALIRRRPKSSHTPIIFITAYADEVHTAHGYELGAVDFILAPVVPEILRTKVKVFVDLFRMTQQIKRQAEEQVALAREQAARSAAEETVQRLNFLAEASKVLASSLDLEDTIRGLLGMVVTRPGDLSVITLFNDQGQLHQTEVAWMNEVDGLRTRSVVDREPFHADFTQALQRVIVTGTPLILSNDNCKFDVFNCHLEIELPRMEVRSVAILPLLARGRALGALSLVMDHSGRQTTDSRAADLPLIEDLAHRAAIAIDNARLYRDIQEADRRKNEFLSVLAHELRNPLAPLLYGIDILRLHAPKQPESKEIQEVQDMMDRQVHHLVRLVDDLLDISRITHDKIQLQMEPIDVAVVVDRALEVSRPVLHARGHKLTLSLPPNSVCVSADPVRLAQVLSNLLNNAAKYTEKGGMVDLSVEREEDDVVFRVRDNGIGIPAGMMPTIFEPFTQVKHSFDRSQGGLGIGLSLVRRLVHMHAGSVHAYSAGPGQGSEFVVRLPFHNISSEMPPSQISFNVDRPACNNGRRRILIVEDNVDVADSTAMLLEQMGSEVQVTHDGPAALAAAEAFRPEIVLLDIGLPGMDGYTVARRLRQQSGPQKLLLVAVSGYGQEEDRQLSSQAGFDLHLVKPASLPELRALIAGAGIGQ
jgi:signal transduction histidine kinase/DNA-binding response OmpR family regulator